LWLIQRTYRRYFYTTWKGNPSSFLPPNSGWWATSPSTFNGRSKWPTSFKNRSRRQISACNVSTVRASQKSSIMTNRKSYTGFPTSYRWSAYVTSKTPKVWLKTRTFLWLLTQHIALAHIRVIKIFELTLNVLHGVYTRCLHEAIAATIAPSSRRSVATATARATVHATAVSPRIARIKNV